MDGEQYMRVHHRYRKVRAVMYLLLVLAGLAAILSPSSLVQSQVGGAIVFVWSSALVISASLALYGALTDKWFGEYTGLPLLAASLSLYGFSALISAGGHLSALLAYGLVVIAFSVGLLARWLDVRDEKKRSEGKPTWVDEE